MNQRLVFAVVFGLAISTASLAFAQNANQAPPSGQNQGSGGGPGNGGGGQRRGPGGGGFGGGMAMGIAGGRGVTGTVTEAAADHFTVKTLTGETYTVQFSANTRFIKQMVRPQGAGQGNSGQGGNGQGGNGQGGNGQGGWQRGQRNGQNAGQGNNQGSGQGSGQRQDRGFGGGGGQPIKATDIKVGDAIAAMGQPDDSAKSIGAVGIVQLDPERAKQMQQMQENYGKTWVMGKVTAINDVQITLQGSLDNAPHTFAADENTSFLQRNNPVTLADIHVGDMVRAEGAVKDGLFTATAVNVMAIPADATRVPRNGSAPQQ